MQLFNNYRNTISTVDQRPSSLLSLRPQSIGPVMGPLPVNSRPNSIEASHDQADGHMIETRGVCILTHINYIIYYCSGISTNKRKFDKFESTSYPTRCCFAREISNGSLDESCPDDSVLHEQTRI
jgi:hypothetical protein